MIDYLFDFNFIGIIITIFIGILLFILYLISLFKKQKILVKLTKIIKIIFIILIIIMFTIITFCLIFDSFTRKNISDKAKEYISNKYNVSIENIDILNYTSGSVPGFCLDECHSKPYRISIKSDVANYCVNAYDLSDKYIYPTKLYWLDEKTDNSSCDEINYDLYYDLDIDK